MPFPRLARLLLAGTLLMSAGLAPGSRAADPPHAVPSLVLKTAHGTIALDSLRGKVVLVDFWASWCGPCHESFPWLDGLQKHYADSGLVVIAVSVDKSIDAADTFLAKHPSSLTIAYDPAGRAAEAFHVRGMPTTFLVGRDGTIRLQHVGFDPRKTAPLERALQEVCTP